MSDKNFMSYGDAETVFTDYANKIKKAEGDEMTLAEYNALSPQEKMSGKAFFVTDAPGGGSGVPDGGTTGQALVKNSNTDGDVKWGNVATPTDIATKANESIITDAYSSSKSYAVGDYCIYNNGLYKCKSACTNVLPTNTTYWTSTQIISELGSGGGDWEFYDVKPSTTTFYSLPSDFKAISIFIVKDVNNGLRIEASRAEVDKLLAASLQNGQYLQYIFDANSATAYLSVKKSGNNYTYCACKMASNGQTWGDSSFSSYVFLK